MENLFKYIQKIIFILFQNMSILLQLDLPPLELKGENEDDRKQYLIAMQRADKGDYSLLEQLLGASLSETLHLSQE